jgi:hypothetical protein
MNAEISTARHPDAINPLARVSMNYGLLDSYLNTEEKRLEHLRGIRLHSCFHRLVINVRGVDHVYENRSEGWVKLGKKTLAQIAQIEASITSTSGKEAVA